MLTWLSSWSGAKGRIGPRRAQAAQQQLQQQRQQQVQVQVQVQAQHGVQAVHPSAAVLAAAGQHQMMSLRLITF